MDKMSRAWGRKGWLGYFVVAITTSLFMAFSPSWWLGLLLWGVVYVGIELARRDAIETYNRWQHKRFEDALEVIGRKIEVTSGDPINDPNAGTWIWVPSNPDHERIDNG